MVDPELRDWAIAVTNGVRLVGILRTRDGGRFLEQALELLPVQRAYVERKPTGRTNGRGQVEVEEYQVMRISGWQLADALAYPSIGAHPIPVPQGALVLPVREYMSLEDVNMLARGIDGFFAARRAQENERLIARAK